MEKGHNWLVVFYDKTSALQYFTTRIKGNKTIRYSTLYLVDLGITKHYEVLTFYFNMMNRNQLGTLNQIMIRELGTPYSILKRCTENCKLIDSCGTIPTPNDDSLQCTIDSFIDGEGDINNVFYKRYSSYFDNLMQTNRVPLNYLTTQQSQHDTVHSSQSEGKNDVVTIQSVNTEPCDKNLFVYGGTEKDRMLYIEKLTVGNSVYFKKSDKFWDGYKNQRYVVISEAPKVSIKRIVERINTWTLNDTFEAETRHRKMLINPKIYILVITASWTLDTLKLEESEKEVFQRFKMIDLTDYERENCCDTSETEELPLPTCPNRLKQFDSIENFKRASQRKKKQIKETKPKASTKTNENDTSLKKKMTDTFKISLVDLPDRCASPQKSPIKSPKEKSILIITDNHEEQSSKDQLKSSDSLPPITLSDDGIKERSALFQAIVHAQEKETTLTKERHTSNSDEKKPRPPKDSTDKSIKKKNVTNKHSHKTDNDNETKRTKHKHHSRKHIHSSRHHHDESRHDSDRHEDSHDKKHHSKHHSKHHEKKEK